MKRTAFSQIGTLSFAAVLSIAGAQSFAGPRVPKISEAIKSISTLKRAEPVNERIRTADIKGLSQGAEVLSLPERVGFGAYRPGVAIEQGLHARYRNAPDEFWLSIIIPQNFAGESALYLHKSGDQSRVLKGEEALNTNFRVLIEKLIAEDANFDIGEVSIMHKLMPELTGLNMNVNETPLEVAIMNVSNKVVVDGTATVTFSIPLGGKAESVERFIKAMKEEFVVYNAEE